MKYQLHQIHLTDAEHDKVNAEGHNSVPKHLAHIDMQVGMGKDISSMAQDAWENGYFTHVSNIEAPTLEGVFHVGNMGPEEAIERLAPMYSTSVGDIVIDPDGKKYVVASFGFQELEAA